MGTLEELYPNLTPSHLVGVHSLNLWPVTCFFPTSSLEKISSLKLCSGGEWEGDTVRSHKPYASNVIIKLTRQYWVFLRTCQRPPFLSPSLLGCLLTSPHLVASLYDRGS